MVSTGSGSSTRTDQNFITRAELINFRSNTGIANPNTLQYLGTFSRERNHPTWGTSLTQLAGRFPLSRFEYFASTPPTDAAHIQQYFGLIYVPASVGPPAHAEHWQYVGTSGSTLLSAIPSISGNNQNPDLFPLLKYALPSASISEILSIGASLIDQRDQNPDTSWIEFDAGGTQKAFGVDRTQSSEIGAPAQPSPLLILNDGTTNYGALRNVGELGYAYRNGTTSLDFRTGGSADSPLLDLFTYNTAITRSGVVSLNSRQPAVLAAILKSALPTLTGTPITASQATNAANSIVNTTATSTGAAIGRQDISRLASSAVVTTAPFNVSGATNEETREAIARALAEVTQTRVWGLLIDVIAQSGRYPPNAASGPNTSNPLANFVVEGEKHYWLHVAIDRFTGEVIDQQLEEVNE